MKSKTLIQGEGKRKVKILFVGSFKNESADGSVGGQMFACKSLVNSTLSNFVDWHLFDVTAASSITAPFFKRIFTGFYRIFTFIYFLFIEKFDFILIFSGSGWGFLEKGIMSILAKIFGIKVIISPRTEKFISDIDKSFIFRFFVKYVIKNSHYIICQGETIKGKWIVRMKDFAEKFIVIPNWIDINEYSGCIVEKQQLPPKLLFLAWLEKRKGIGELLTAIELLHKDGEKFNLVIAGDGMEKEMVLEFIKHNNLGDKVQALGWVKDSIKRDLIQKSDIYILPSYIEGLPNSLLEMMASGKVCIVTNVGAIPDVIEHMSNGILITKQNPNDIYNNLKLLFRNPDLRVTLGKNAQNYITKNHSLSVAINKFQQLFDLTWPK